MINDKQKMKLIADFFPDCFFLGICEYGLTPDREGTNEHYHEGTNEDFFIISINSINAPTIKCIPR
jgi:hypothetical protein